MSAAYIETLKTPYRTPGPKKKELEFTSANKMREALGMRLVKQGNRDCLDCDLEFFSFDLVNQKCCDYCRQLNKEE